MEFVYSNSEKHRNVSKLKEIVSLLEFHSREIKICTFKVKLNEKCEF